MSVLYPSQEWCDAWKEAINNSEDAEKKKIDLSEQSLSSISPELLFLQKHDISNLGFDITLHEKYL